MGSEMCIRDRAMASSEERAYPILRKHDVDYVLIIYGGLIGFSGDDLNKFLWMIRISQGVWPDEVHEPSFFTPRGEFRLDDKATETMRESIMYKMSYYRLNDLYPGSAIQDRARQTEGPSKSPRLDTLEEAFTSENWIVRIYQVKKEDSLARPLREVGDFNEGKRLKAPLFALNTTYVQ